MEPMENIRTVLAANMKAGRKKLSLNQDQLAEASGLSVGMIKNIELGNRWPSPETIVEIAKALKVTESELFDGPREEIEIPMSVIAKRISSVPDEVYRLASKLDPKDKAWEEIIGALEAAIITKEKNHSSKTRTKGA